ncbi:complement component C1q receptor [Tiliqua scincoides]|uniref:complement component C1q receptor n=1 Tax=Tiliqua scincoides TaxID=71010 RepID=UPI003461C297
MEFLFQLFWKGLLLVLTAQPSEEVEALCSGSSCYTLHWGRHSWMEAQMKCQDNGGNLMTLKNQKEALLVLQLLNKVPNWGAGTGMEVRLWIGLHREKGKCYQKHQLLRGFSWVTGGEETEYSNWVREPRESCTVKKCVTLQGTSSSQELAWTDGHCGSSGDGHPGYLCKFSFQGMCQSLVLAGPGTVNYSTPFGVATSSLAVVPFGSTASVTCGAQKQELSNVFLVCKAQPNTNTFEWNSPGPLCASSSHGCSYSNGGCEHECQELDGGLFQCACRSGYQLGGDHLSCIPVDYCSSNPCQGQCLQRPGGFECLCSVGYMLAEDGLSCVDVDECSFPQSPCEQICVNQIGTFNCLCNSGYKLAGPDGKSCQDIDECAGDTPCAQICVNTHSSFHCACQPGYQLESVNSTSCLDVDECQEEPCEHSCKNHPGSYQCFCKPGWILAPNGISCLLDSTASTSSPWKKENWGIPLTQEEGKLGNPVNIDSVSETPALPSDSPVQAEQERVSVSQYATSQPDVLISPPDAEDQIGDDNINNNNGSSKQLLYYILGGVATVFLLMAFALSLVAYKRMKTKKAKKKAKSATDNYSWEPDQEETRRGGTEYM